MLQKQIYTMGTIFLNISIFLKYIVYFIDVASTLPLSIPPKEASLHPGGIYGHILMLDKIPRDLMKTKQSPNLKFYCLPFMIGKIKINNC